MNLRQADRVGPFSNGSLYFEFDGIEGIRAGIADISLKGVGYEIRGLKETDLPVLKSSEVYFIKLIHMSHSLLAGVKNVWCSEVTGADVPQLKGGVEINIISPEDNLTLHAIIESFRKIRQDTPRS